jgi:hypothetical protein
MLPQLILVTKFYIRRRISRVYGMIEEITALLQMYFHLLEGPVQEVQFLKETFWTISAVGNSRRCCR